MADNALSTAAVKEEPDSQNEPDDPQARPNDDANRILQKSPLQIPEVLMMIFLSLRNHDCATCARVCRLWSGIALDKLWRDLSTPRHLLGLAGTLILTNAGCVYEEPYLWDNKWASFLPKATRVRSLAVDMATDFNGRSLHSDVPAKLQHRLSSTEQRHLLPGLRRLTWNVRSMDDVRAVVPFIPPSLEKLELIFYASHALAEQHIVSLLKSAAPMMPRLQALRLQIYGNHTPQLRSALAQTLRQLPCLTKLQLPSTPTTEDIMLAIAACGNIVELELQTLLEEDALIDFAETIAASCPAAKSLTLHLPRTTNQNRQSYLHFQMLSPLLRCRELRCLRILHPRLVFMEEADMRAAGQAWPHLEILHLSGGKQQIYVSGTSPGPLRVLAESFGQTLIEFGQAFVMQKIPTGEQPAHVFKKLQVLDIGATSVPPLAPDVIALAAFLGALCPPGIDIQHMHQRGDSAEKWNNINVRAIVGLVHQAREQGYRQRAEEDAQRR